MLQKPFIAIACCIRKFNFSGLCFAKCSLENAQKILWLVEKLSRKGLVVEIQKKDIIQKYSSGSTKGGQKANKSHSLVNLKHIPTGKVSEGRETRNVPDNHKYAMAKLRMAVDIHLKGDDSIFVTIKKEEEERARLKRELKKAQNEAKRQNEEKLLAILKEEDTLKY